MRRHHADCERWRRRFKLCKSNDVNKTNNNTTRRRHIQFQTLGYGQNCKRCTKCGQIKSSEAFLLHQRKSYKRLICMDCIHPQCKNTHCTTCKICRDVNCRKQNCNEKPRGLLGLAAICNPDNYECHACLYPKCACGIEMSKETRRHKKKSKDWMSTVVQRQWTCNNCQTRSQYKHEYGLLEQLTSHMA